VSLQLVKKLDKLIVNAFIGPFIATFFITLFVLVLQFFWLYIDDIVGKGVDLFTVLRLVSYVGATLVPLALPLAVLLSSIMTFGNLGETFELVAIKSAGISLLRFMRPLFLVSLLICYIAFLFNNYIIPVANLKFNTLKYDIIVSKPAFDIKEGVFYDKIDGYVIKIGKKEKDDSTIRNVVIYEQNFAGLQDHIIVAEKGKMVVTPDKKSLVFKLQDGWIYQENGERQSLNTEFIRMGFKEFKKVLDLSSFKLNKTDDSAFKNNFQMLSLRQLGKTIDSLKRIDSGYGAQASKDVRSVLKFLKFVDSGWKDQHVSLPPPGKLTDVLPLPPPKDTTSPKDSAAKALAIRKQITADSIKNVHRRDSMTRIYAARARTARKDSVRKFGLAKIMARRDSMARKSMAQNMVRKDTAKPLPPASPAATAKTAPATAVKAPEPKRPREREFIDLLPDSTRLRVMEQSVTQITSSKAVIDQPAVLYNNGRNDLLQHQIAWHEKLTLSAACLVMFLIGAPLGSIIRKGGIGLPLVFAVVFFVVFFLLNNFGKKFVKQEVMTPVGGMWLATYILTPIGIFLIYKALHDSQLFNKEFYFRLIKNIRTWIKAKRT